MPVTSFEFVRVHQHTQLNPDSIYNRKPVPASVYAGTPSILVCQCKIRKKSVIHNPFTVLFCQYLLQHRLRHCSVLVQTLVEPGIGSKGWPNVLMTVLENTLILWLLCRHAPILFPPPIFETRTFPLPPTRPCLLCFNPNRSLDFVLISVFLASRFICTFPKA